MVANAPGELPGVDAKPGGGVEGGLTCACAPVGGNPCGPSA
ncbi:MAG: hypothetical protein M5U28_37660 [Sandaracinaceae bacterium]|nr:hypothetical protein [Sandaracinaceae bacterium]